MLGLTDQKCLLGADGECNEGIKFFKNLPDGG